MEQQPETTQHRRRGGQSAPSTPPPAPGNNASAMGKLRGPPSLPPDAHRVVVLDGRDDRGDELQEQDKVPWVGFGVGGDKIIDASQLRAQPTRSLLRPPTRHQSRQPTRPGATAADRPPHSLVDPELAPRLDQVVGQLLHHLGVAARVDGGRGDGEVRVGVEGDGLLGVVLAHVLQDLVGFDGGLGGVSGGVRG